MAAKTGLAAERVQGTTGRNAAVGYVGLYINKCYIYMYIFVYVYLFIGLYSVIYGSFVVKYRPSNGQGTIAKGVCIPGFYVSWREGHSFEIPPQKSSSKLNLPS